MQKVAKRGAHRLILHLRKGAVTQDRWGTSSHARLGDQPLRYGQKIPLGTFYFQGLSKVGTSQESECFPAEVPEPREVQAVQCSSLSYTSWVGNTWHPSAFTTAPGLSRLWYLHRYTSWVEHSWEEPPYNDRQENTCSEDANRLWTQQRPKSCWENSEERQALCGSVGKWTSRLALLHIFWHRYLSKCDVQAFALCLSIKQHSQAKPTEEVGGSGGASFPFRTTSR